MSLRRLGLCLALLLLLSPASRSVPALEVNQTSTGTATVTVPSTMTLGAYYLIARADNAGNVTESDETNNCLASDSTVQVTAP